MFALLCIILTQNMHITQFQIIWELFENFDFFEIFRHFAPPKIHIRDPQTQISPRDPPKSDSSRSLKRRKNTKLSLEIKNKLSRSIQTSFIYNICSNIFFTVKTKGPHTFSIFYIFFNFFRGANGGAFRFGFGGKQ